MQPYVTDRWLNIWCISHIILEALQEFRRRHWIGQIIQDFWEMWVSCSLTFCLETKLQWCQTSLWKKKAVVFATMATSAYQDQLNARFSKVCEIFQVRGIESFRYVQEFYTPVCYCGDISMPLNMTRHKTKRDWLLYLQSYSLLGGPWPFKAAKVPRPPSAVSLKVWLRETNHSKPAAICWLLLNFMFLYSKFNLKH